MPTLVMSGGSSYVTVRVAAPVLPAASWAVTVRTLVPGWRGIPLTVQFVVPLAVPLPPRSFVQLTWVTPTLSAAVPARLRGLLFVLYVGAEVGEVMLSVGGVLLGACGVALAVAPVDTFPAASKAHTE
jgi:hypothetical protein